ncbi:alpha/beta fold hydrolase [Acuticoccus kandeliae]|uniref:alpha/beta fold hydrolase n=1 Tax=Acuticoccus kandeliae TaxID=2073160 RepID=UPI000D3E0F5B|nr:alpha/beta fold hydrolase [Acuticoccus kandeliae]
MTTAPATRVIALHAATRDRHDFAGLIDALPGFAFDCRDLLGHGDAPRIPDYSVEAMADEIAPLVGDDRPLLYGHSLGGLVALATAARLPGRVRALVLEDAPLFEAMMPRLAETNFYRGFQGLKRLMTGRAAGYTRADWEREVANWPSGHRGQTMTDAFGEPGIRLRAGQLAAFDPRVLDALMDGHIADGYDAIALLRRVAIPVIYIAGSRDLGSAITPEDVARIAAEPNVTVDQVTDEGHFIHEVMPERCATAVRTLATA